ncbi:MAG: hypothetical protein K9N22_03230 [Candidatus Marinimicrobia bacterium]|nr:hypothetical protein [Candidatus Neomarinimicrobiota bacterium]
MTTTVIALPAPDQPRKTTSGREHPAWRETGMRQSRLWIQAKQKGLLRLHPEFVREILGGSTWN